MSDLLHRSPSVGGLVKKIMAINPDLGVQEIMLLIRRCIRTQGGSSIQSPAYEVVDEQLAISLAKATLIPAPPKGTLS